MSDPAAPLVAHGQLQLQIKAEVSSSYDAVALGLLTVLVAIATAVIGGRDSLGGSWWAVLPTLGAAFVACLSVLYMGDLHVGLPLEDAVRQYKGRKETQINTALVLDLVGTLRNADELLENQRLALTLAIMFIIGTAASTLIVLATN